MRVLTWLCLLTVMLAVGFAAFSNDTGYVLISWGKTSVEMSLVLAVFIAVLWVWIIARLVSLELWLRGSSTRLSKRISHKKTADKPLATPAPTKNWTPGSR
ncbi:MAG: heme biosynthesis HemY N-terminal domain-containing protein [Paraperlucidibaca sp.]